MSWLDAARGSLRARLALGLISGTVTVLGLSYVLLHLIIRDEIYQHLDEDLRLRAGAVANYAVMHPGNEDVSTFMPRFRAGAHEDVFQIWDAHGRTLARSASALHDLPLLQGRPGESLYREVALPDGHRGRAIVEMIPTPPDDPRGFLTVVTGEETENLQGLETRVHVTLLLAALTSCIAIVAIAGYSIGRGLAPVHDFARSLERVNPDDPGARLDTANIPRELQPAADSFSALLSRLLDALAREKRYARNVAHELRNPLAEIRLLVDVGAARTDTDELRRTIQSVGATAGEMERTVDTLLALTRYEAGLESPQPEPVQLCGEVRRIVAAAMSQAGKRHISFAVELPAECWVHTDSTLITRLVSNLIGNAVAHAPENSCVRIRLDDRGGLCIANEAPLLSAESLAHLGEPFFRAGGSDRGGHSGLGLSLAMAMSRVLGLHFSTQLDAGQFLNVCLHGFRHLSDAAPIESPGVDTEDGTA